MLDFDVLKLSTDYPDLISSLFGVFLTYCLSVIVAFTSVKTFLGLFDSRSYIQAMILSAIVVCCAMQAIGDNLARGLGVMGALSIIRFRTNLNEPRDMIFLFACLAIGIANGVHSYSIVIVATFGFCLAAVTLYSPPLAHIMNISSMWLFSRRRYGPKLGFFLFSNLFLSLLLPRHVSAVEAGTQCLPMSEQFAYVLCLSQLAEDTYQVTPKD